LTYAFTANADGSERLPAFVIGKAKKPRAFRNKTGTQLGFYYQNNAKAWMTASLYQEWLEQWDRELGLKNRKILLLQDNFSGHIVPDGLRNIRVENFEPNLTAHVQPMDQGIIRCFKAHYRAKYIRRAIDRYDSGVTPSEIYDIDQLQAMWLADAAWREVDTTTIRHCWFKAAILPDMDPPAVPNPSIPISSLIHADKPLENPVEEAEKQVQVALDELVSTGSLQARNRMDLEELLNPADEAEIISETTDEAICKAVLDAKQAQEDTTINGGDDDVDDDASVHSCPKRREVLQAVLVITRYAGFAHNPVARKLEGILASFRHQINLEDSRAKVPTLVTDYFSRR
jgi:hypothetical protein